jgi:hypothetical protein
MNIETIEMTPDTPIEIIEKATEAVEAILAKHFPDHIAFEKGKYTISRGSTQVMVVIRPFTAKDCSIEFIATVVTDAKVDAELSKFLLRTNTELHIGGFGLMFDDTIVYQHSLPGETVSDESFAVALNAVAAIADYYDDEIIKLAGGKRACDSTIDE